MIEPIFVDTSVWVYAVDAADPAKRERALEVTAPAPGRDLVISTQVLTEFYAVVTRKLVVPVPPEDAEALVRQLAILPWSRSTARSSLRRSPEAVSGGSQSGTP